MKTTKPRGQEAGTGEQAEAGVSKLKLALGAAGLFLFIVGVKRSFRTDEQHEEAADEGQLGDGAGADR